MSMENSTHGQYQNQIDYILCSQRWRSSIQSAKTRLGADCGSDHELLVAKFILKLKKVRKTTRPFKYDLNQIPYDYTVEVRNRFKSLDLIDRVPDELWNEVGWHHWLDGRESQWTLGVGDGQGGLASCDSWGRKKSDMTERLNWTELTVTKYYKWIFSQLTCSY